MCTYGCVLVPSVLSTITTRCVWPAHVSFIVVRSGLSNSQTVRATTAFVVTPEEKKRKKAPKISNIYLLTTEIYFLTEEIREKFLPFLPHSKNKYLSYLFACLRALEEAPFQIEINFILKYNTYVHTYIHK